MRVEARRAALCDVRRPRSMTRHSRGTQLSIIDWQEVPVGF
ncbi:hypothetical protein [Streptomyces durbertensis]|nr:hypothetical protein [Streptomyces durbertensis]